MSENINKTKAKITLKFTFGKEDELTPDYIRDGFRETVEKIDEIKNKFEELIEKIPDDMSDEIFDEWIDAIDEINESLEDVESAIDDAEDIENEE